MSQEPQIQPIVATVNMTYCFVSADEYRILKEENLRLHREREELWNLREQNLQDLNIKNKTIDELKKENDSLREEIELLKNRNKILEEENTRYKLKMNSHDSELKQLKYDMYIAKMSNKILILMQTINSTYKLEKGAPKHLKAKLENMRKYRNVVCHYIDDEDSNELKQYKTNKIIDLFNTLPKQDILDISFNLGFNCSELLAYILTKIVKSYVDESKILQTERENADYML